MDEQHLFIFCWLLFPTLTVLPFLPYTMPHTSLPSPLRSTRCHFLPSSLHAPSAFFILYVHGYSRLFEGLLELLRPFVERPNFVLSGVVLHFATGQWYFFFIIYVYILISCVRLKYSNKNNSRNVFKCCSEEIYTGSQDTNNP